jgi:hypothetical protein
MSLKRRSFLLTFFLVTASATASAQWVTVEPGGRSLCADGSPYRFFVHPGSSDKLLIEFEGGGGCWSAESCDLDIYTRRIATDPESARQQGSLRGIYDRANLENPFREFTHVYIPYCTGDLHLGNRTHNYTGALRGSYTVEHRGAANAGAALNWASSNVANPGQVVVAGCSAGGYASIVWSAQIAQRYPGARLAHLSDSAAGVTPPGFFATALSAWNVTDAWPSFIPSLALSSLDLAHVTMPDVYGGIAGHFPLASFSQFNTRQDSTQLFFYILTKGSISATDQADWTNGMLSSIDRIEAENPNFHAFTATGTQHCVINQASFYTTSAGGKRVVDWVKALVESGDPGSVR